MSSNKRRFKEIKLNEKYFKTEESYEETLMILCEKSRTCLNELKNGINREICKKGFGFAEMLDSWVSNSEAEIEIRVESLKIQIRDKAKKLKKKYQKRQLMLIESVDIKSTNFSDRIELETAMIYSNKINKKLACIEKFKVINHNINMNHVGDLNWMLIIKHRIQTLKQISDIIVNKSKQINLKLQVINTYLHDVVAKRAYCTNVQMFYAEDKMKQIHDDVKEVLFDKKVTDSYIKNLELELYDRELDSIIYCLNDFEEEMKGYRLYMSNIYDDATILRDEMTDPNWMNYGFLRF